MPATTERGHETLATAALDGLSVTVAVHATTRGIAARSIGSTTAPPGGTLVAQHTSLLL